MSISELQLKTSQAIANAKLGPGVKRVVKALSARAKLAVGDDLIQVGREAQELVDRHPLPCVLITDVADADGLAFWGEDERSLDERLSKAGVDLVELVDYEAIDLNPVLMSDQLRDAYHCARKALPITWGQLLGLVEAAGFSGVNITPGVNRRVDIDVKGVSELLVVRASDESVDWLDVRPPGFSAKAIPAIEDLKKYLANMFASRSGA